MLSADSAAQMLLRDMLRAKLNIYGCFARTRACKPLGPNGRRLIPGMVLKAGRAGCSCPLLCALMCPCSASSLVPVI